MATVTAGTPIYLDSHFEYLLLLDVESIASTSPTLLRLHGPEGEDLRISGTGFTYEEGFPTGGTATGFKEFIETTNTFSITGMSVTVANFNTFVSEGYLDVLGLIEYALRGADTINGSSGQDGLLGYNGIDTINGNGGDDVIDGGTGNDTLNGGEGNDLLYGEAGADTLNGGTGADTMTGGASGDTYIVDNEEDSALESSDGGVDKVRASVSHSLNTWVENLTLLGTANINGTGNSEDNQIIGNSGNNILNGGSGNDLLTGNAGNDSYYVDSSDDEITELAGGGTDTAYVTAESYTLPGFVERLTLLGEATQGTGNTMNNVMMANEGGSSTLSGAAGNDAITGFEGNDILRGGAGNDTLTGGSGDDELHGDSGIDSMTGGQGSDEYWLTAGDTATEGVEGGSDTIYANFTVALSNYPNFEHIRLSGTANINATGNADSNTIYGNSGANILNGGGGGDSIFGGGGADTIYGKAGFDTLSGGGGNDSFVFDTAIGGEENNSVIDFATGQDTIVLDKTIFTTLAVGTLPSNRFTSGPGLDEATTTAHRIIYDTGTGNLYYDADGSGETFAPIQFANISGGPDLSASDISVVA